MKAASTAISPTLMAIIWLPWPTVSTMPSNVTVFSAACFRPSKVLPRESSLRPVRETRRAGLTSSIWTPFLPLAGKRKSALGLEPVCLGKRAQQHLAVTDRDRTRVEQCLRAARCRRACSGSSPRGATKSSTVRLPAFSVRLVAQNELVRPGHRVAGLVLTRAIAAPGSSRAARRWRRGCSLSCGLDSETGPSSA